MLKIIQCEKSLLGRVQEYCRDQTLFYRRIRGPLSSQRLGPLSSDSQESCCAKVPIAIVSTTSCNGWPDLAAHASTCIHTYRACLEGTSCRHVPVRRQHLHSRCAQLLECISSSACKTLSTMRRQILSARRSSFTWSWSFLWNPCCIRSYSIN